MKISSIKKLILIILALSLTLILFACQNNREPEFFDVTYSVSQGGIIVGQENQTVKKGGRGSEVIAAAVHDGYDFVGWSDGVKIAVRTDLNIMQDMTLTAYFERNEIGLQYFIVSYTAKNGGEIAGDFSQNILYGENAVTVKAIPDTGYRFVKWSDGNTDPVRQDLNIKSEIQAIAIFELLNFQVEYKADTGGYIIGEATQAVRYGEMSRLVSATAYYGYEFDRWSDGLGAAERTDIITEKTQFIAYFIKLKTAILQYSAGVGGHIQGEKVQEVAIGDSGKSVTAVPDSGYIFIKWSDGVTNSKRQDIADEDRNFTAEFKKIFDGIGSIRENPFLISSYEDLMNMVYYPNSYYKMTNDIDLSGISYEPVFDNNACFYGVFDGDGFTINNLTIDKNTGFPSLFGFVGGGAIVQNFSMTDVSIHVPNYNTGDWMCVGAVSAVCYGELRDINVSGEIKGDSINYGPVMLGGLAGWTDNRVENCHSDISIWLNDIILAQSQCALNVGGLIGFSEGDIISCSAKGSIRLTSDLNDRSDARNIGGLIGIFVDTGYVTEVNITDSFSEVGIYSNCESVCGGLLGYVFYSDVVFNVSDCYATGEVFIERYGYAGGLFGIFEAGAGSEIKNCSASGNVTAEKAAGFAETIWAENEDLIITGCYSAGNVYFTYQGSGFCNSADAQISYCYSSSDVTSLTSYNSYAAGFVYYFGGNILCCYSTGDVQTNYVSTGFIYSLYGSVKESFSSGTVSSRKIGCGFVVSVSNSEIINCYSLSDINMPNDLDNAFMVGGLAAGTTNNTILKNSYYAGKISGAGSDRSVIGAVAAQLNGNITNCHWLYHEDSPASQAFGIIGSGISEIYRYENPSEMYSIAALLNAANSNPVWTNKENATPQLKSLIE